MSIFDDSIMDKANVANSGPANTSYGGMKGMIATDIDKLEYKLTSSKFYSANSFSNTLVDVSTEKLNELGMASSNLLGLVEDTPRMLSNTLSSVSSVAGSLAVKYADSITNGLATSIKSWSKDFAELEVIWAKTLAYNSINYGNISGLLDSFKPMKMNDLPKSLSPDPLYSTTIKDLGNTLITVNGKSNVISTVNFGYMTKWIISTDLSKFNGLITKAPKPPLDIIVGEVKINQFIDVENSDDVDFGDFKYPNELSYKYPLDIEVEFVENERNEWESWITNYLDNIYHFNTNSQEALTESACVLTMYITNKIIDLSTKDLIPGKSIKDIISEKVSQNDYIGLKGKIDFIAVPTSYERQINNENETVILTVTFRIIGDSLVGNDDTLLNWFYKHINN